MIIAHLSNVLKMMSELADDYQDIHFSIDTCFNNQNNDQTSIS